MIKIKYRFRLRKAGHQIIFFETGTFKFGSRVSNSGGRGRLQITDFRLQIEDFGLGSWGGCEFGWG